MTKLVKVSERLIKDLQSSFEHGKISSILDAHALEAGTGDEQQRFKVIDPTGTYSDFETGDPESVASALEAGCLVYPAAEQEGRWTQQYKVVWEGIGARWDDNHLVTYSLEKARSSAGTINNRLDDPKKVKILVRQVSDWQHLQGPPFTEAERKVFAAVESTLNELTSDEERKMFLNALQQRIVSGG